MPEVRIIKHSDVGKCPKVRVFVMGPKGGPKHVFEATRHDLRLFAESILKGEDK